MKLLFLLVLPIAMLFFLLFAGLLGIGLVQGGCDGNPADIDTVHAGDIPKTIYNVGREVGASPRAMESAFLAARVESGFRNPTEAQSDRDSAGVFQQRRGWVPVSQRPAIWSGPDDPRMNPAWAVAAYFKGSNGHKGALYYDAVGIDFAGRKIVSAGQLAQATQVSAFPSRYDAARSSALAVMNNVSGTIGVSLVEGCAVVAPIPNAGSATPLDVRWLSAERLNKAHHDYPALDLPATKGTPFFAVAGGKVSAVMSSGACGNGVQIIDATNAVWLYCHASRVDVHPGAVVQTSQQLGAVGNTGHVVSRGGDGSHLHIQVKVGGELRCPQTYVASIVRGQRPPAPASLPASGCSYRSRA